MLDAHTKLSPLVHLREKYVQLLTATQSKSKKWLLYFSTIAKNSLAGGVAFAFHTVNELLMCDNDPSHYTTMATAIID